MKLPHLDIHRGRATTIVLRGYDVGDERRREALFTLGNGMLSVRGCAPESFGNYHYPGTYRAGCYNRLTDIVQGKTVENEALVNLPNWLPLAFRIAAEDDWVSLDSVDILLYRHTLHIAHGAATRNVLFQDRRGRRTRLYERRFVSMAQPHLAALQWRLTAENWTDSVEIRSAIDGNVVNGNVERFKLYDPRHLEVLDAAAQDNITVLEVRTRQSRIEVVTAVRTYVEAIGEVSCTSECNSNSVANFIICAAHCGRPLAIEKTAAIYTSRDPAITEPREAALSALRDAPRFEPLLRDHMRSWRRVWRGCRIEVDDESLARATRFHMLHLVNTISTHSIPLDIGFPARGWQEAYHGQIFWDETLAFPFFSSRHPELSRSLLLYRYRRLGEARRAARRRGYRGAMFPWRSASTGQETTPTFQLNPLSGRWMPDHTDLQKHVGAAIAFNVWAYFLATADIEFMSSYGAEMIIEIARFWASAAQFQQSSERYEIRNVVGPDEYHTVMPGAREPGVNNNAYTNVMAAWTLACAVDVLQEIPARSRLRLCDYLQLKEVELDHWKEMSRKITIPFHDGVISQFEGFGTLKELDASKIADHARGRRIDWVLNSNDDSINAYQVVKQADVLMLFYLFGTDELVGFLRRLGYSADLEGLKRTAEYYLRRTSHDSSLSRIVCAGAMARLDPAESWRLYREALRPELNPANKVSSKEGLHLGAMAATIDVLQRHYLGLRFERSGLALDPALPARLGGIKLLFQYSSDEFELESVGSRLIVRGSANNRGTTELRYKELHWQLPPGGALEFKVATSSS